MIQAMRLTVALFGRRLPGLRRQPVFGRSEVTCSSRSTGPRRPVLGAALALCSSTMASCASRTLPGARSLSCLERLQPGIRGSELRVAVRRAWWVPRSLVTVEASGLGADEATGSGSCRLGEQGGEGPSGSVHPRCGTGRSLDPPPRPARAAAAGVLGREQPDASDSDAVADAGDNSRPVGLRTAGLPCRQTRPGVPNLGLARPRPLCGTEKAPTRSDATRGAMGAVDATVLCRRRRRRSPAGALVRDTAW